MGYAGVAIFNGVPDVPRTRPSVIAFTKTGERLVGQIAKRQAASHKPAEAMYKSASTQPDAQAQSKSGGGTSENNGGKANVVDAEFVDAGH